MVSLYSDMSFSSGDGYRVKLIVEFGVTIYPLQEELDPNHTELHSKLLSHGNLLRPRASDLAEKASGDNSGTVPNPNHG
jgi:hypothetical protein